MFSGTEVIQTRRESEEGTLALVTRTGFSTTKGGLIRSILYSAPSRFNLYQDTYIILVFSVSIAIIAWGTVMGTYVKYYQPWDIIVRSLNDLTMAVPAALPIVMSVAILFGMKRLYDHNVYTTSPFKINNAGRVSKMVFDKTGTLTEESLKVSRFKIASNEEFLPTLTTSSTIVDDKDCFKSLDSYAPVGQDAKVKYLECMS